MSMWLDEDPEERNPRSEKMRVALERAHRYERPRTVPVRVDGKTVVWITPEQSADPQFMKRFNKRWEQR